MATILQMTITTTAAVFRVNRTSGGACEVFPVVKHMPVWYAKIMSKCDRVANSCHHQYLPINRLLIVSLTFLVQISIPLYYSDAHYRSRRDKICPIFPLVAIIMQLALFSRLRAL